MILIDAEELLDIINNEIFPDYQTYSKIFDMIDNAPEIAAAPVKQGRWIPCKERMPEEPFGCLVTVMDTEPMTGEDFENILPYFVGWDGEQWNDDDGERCPFEVVAWMRLPEPYMMEDLPELRGKDDVRG